MLVGTKTADDAAVYRLSETQALVQTVDFFTPVVDDPYSFGAIAAANALSDVYAMGGQPAFALNIVGFPRDNEALPLSVLGEILRGGAEKALEAGVAIVGGHTIDDNEPKYGLCVSGFVHPKRYWTNTGARPGDILVLTKPLGTGIITTALRAGEADEDVIAHAVETMATLNRSAAQTASAFEVHACTDVTGFGFLGHLREMQGDNVGFRVDLSAIPVLEGARELAARGFIPGGARRNWLPLEHLVSCADHVSEGDRLLLCDPQTSGGLLIAVTPQQASDLIAGLAAAGVDAAKVAECVDAPLGAQMDSEGETAIRIE